MSREPAISNLSSALKSVNLDGQNHHQQQNQQQQQHQQQQHQQQHQQASTQELHQHLTNNNGHHTQQTNNRISHFFQNLPDEGFTLFSHRSAPNGFKVAIVLSELGLNYNTIFLDFNAGEQRAPEFVQINPNARVPALIDHQADQLSLWESGAIMLYLCHKFSREYGECPLWPVDSVSDQSQIMSWLFFQTSGHAPMIGQALHFRYFHSQQVPSALQRYTEEVRRVYGVVEMALAEKRESIIMELDTENAAAYSTGTTPLSQSKFFDYPVWLVGDAISIADLAFVPWNNVVDRVGIDIKVEFPEVYKWTKTMMRRPAVVRALRGDQ